MTVELRPAEQHHRPPARHSSRRPMRIGLISEYFYPDCAGGTGTVLSHLARCLKDTYEDIEIEVITSRNRYRGDSKPLAARETWHGIKILRLSTPHSKRRSPFARLASNTAYSAATLLRALVRRNYDLLLVGTAPPTLPLAAQAYRRLTGTPYVYIVYDLYPDIAMALGVLPRRSLPIRSLQRLQRSWLHSASKTIVLGRCMRDYLVAHYGVPPQRIEVIPVGADAARVFPAGRTTRFRTRHEINGFLVLYAGNLGWHQDFDTLLDAAKQLAHTEPDLTLVFVGDGAKRAHIAQRIVAESIANVRLFPFVPEDDFADMMASADVSMVTLEPGAEGLGVPSKFYNILASGRPAVGLVGPGSEVAQVIAEADCGVRVDQGDPTRLALVLSSLRRSPLRVGQMGHNARTVFLEKYTTQRVAAQFHRTLMGAIQAAGSREHASVAPHQSHGMERSPVPPTAQISAPGPGARTPFDF